MGARRVRRAPLATEAANPSAGGAPSNDAVVGAVELLAEGGPLSDAGSAAGVTEPGEPSQTGGETPSAGKNVKDGHTRRARIHTTRVTVPEYHYCVTNKTVEEELGARATVQSRRISRPMTDRLGSKRRSECRYPGNDFNKSSCRIHSIRLWPADLWRRF